MSQHVSFIETPLSRILDDAAARLLNIDCCLNDLPLQDCFMQSLFMQLSGAQEQKFKCIMWECATVDYAFRFEQLGRPSSSIPGYSTLKEKSCLLKYIVDSLKSRCFFDSDAVSGVIDRNALIKKVVDTVGRLYFASGKVFDARGYFAFHRLFEAEWPEKIFPKGDGNFFVQSLLFRKQSTIFGTDNGIPFVDFYNNIVYKHRNSCAHNTASYQRDLPSFDALNVAYRDCYNYYVRFAILLIIDEIIMALFGEYRKTYEECEL